MIEDTEVSYFNQADSFVMNEDICVASFGAHTNVQQAKCIETIYFSKFYIHPFPSLILMKNNSFMGFS
jgi:hypothetical protein